MNKYLFFSIFILLLVVGFFYINNRGSRVETKKLDETITIKGSDTEVQLVSNLAESFSSQNPKTKISVTGGGSGVGIAALINKEANVANSSRKISEEEVKQGKKANLSLQEFILARDGLSIIVHPENKITSLSIEEIGKIYQGKIKNWQELKDANQPIVLYGRQSTSGTYVFFRDTVVKDDYSDEMKNMEGSQAIVNAVMADKNGIGYVGVGYVKGSDGKTLKGIKVLSIALPGKKMISPLDKEAVNRGEYPIYRPIFQYLSALPKKGSVLESFLTFETSEKGNEIVEKSGFYPITAEDKKQNQKLFEKIR